MLTETQRAALTDQFDAWCDDRLRALAGHPLSREEVSSDLTFFALVAVGEYGPEAIDVLRGRVHERVAAGTWLTRQRIDLG